MKITDLLTSDDGRLSHTKLWSNVAYLIATVVVLIMACNGTLGIDVFGTYLGVVGAHNALSKWVGTHYRTRLAQQAGGQEARGDDA